MAPARVGGSPVSGVFLQVWQRLEGRRFRPAADDLAREFGVNRRTILRDIAILEELYFDVPPPMPIHYYGALGGEVTANNAQIARRRK